MNLAVSAPDGLFPIAGIVRPCSPNAVASSFAQHVGLGLSVVLFQHALYCFRPIVGAAEGIVLPSWGYCPTLMCLFMLLVSLSGQPQFYATGPPCSHSHSPPTSGLLLQRQAFEERVCVRACVCMYARLCAAEEICLCDWVTCIVCKKKKKT